MSDSDPYSRVEYRRLIAWPQRIQREWPMLSRVLATGPSRRVLDLGCGPGEHSRRLAAEGFDMVGVDASEAMLEQARSEPEPPNLQFVLGDLRDLPAATDGPFGGAICLGNTLPHLLDRDDLLRMARGLRERLSPGAPFLLQILNYDRILETGERALPVNFRPDPEGELVFVRLMTPQEDGTVLFYPMTLLLRPGGDPPLELKHAREVRLRGWRRAELEEAFAEAGFPTREAFGGFDGGPWEAGSSRDLILVVR
ncbi:MAG: class I SAM-dependent methyltransferase [Thermoanaerobaculia bacterium]